jgi:DDE superfamily endonuclease
MVIAIGFCSVASITDPVDYYVYTDTRNDSSRLSSCVERSIAKGFLQAWDVLIIDNKCIYRSPDVFNLSEWLWDTYRILLLYLPPRSPDLNPMKLLWKLVSRRLNHLMNVNHPWMPNDAVAAASQTVLSSISHVDVLDAYRMCGY